MKRRIIKGQAGLPEIKPLTQEYADSVWQAQQSIPYDEPWWVKTVRYVQNPFSIVSDYVYDSDWAPNWLKDAMPFVDLGVGLAANKTLIPKVKTYQATVSKGGNTLRPSEQYDEQVYNHRRVNNYGKSTNVRTTETPSQSAEWEEADPYQWKLQAYQKKAAELNGQSSRTSTGTPATPQKSDMQSTKGRPNQDATAQRNAKYLRRGTGILPVTSKSVAQKYIGYYFTAVEDRYNTLLASLKSFDSKLQAGAKWQTSQEISRLRQAFDKECKRVRALGHEVNVPDALKKIMYP